MRFEVTTPARVLFGEGVVADLPDLVREVAGGGAADARDSGRPVRALVVVGSSLARTDGIRAALAAAGAEVTSFQVDGEPTVDVARAGADVARRAGADVVVAVGGGSVLDTGKAVAALAANDGDALDYLEVIGRGRALTAPSLPMIAVPTTAGSGSEATRNAVLASPEHAVKVSLRSATMLPRVALVDPELTYAMPPAVTASTGLDAFTQVLEPFVSRHASPFTDTLARDGIARAARSLRAAYEDGRDVEARRDMALTSLFGGLALANSRLGAVHGLAGPLGGMVESPHGAVCARLLPPVMAINVAALRSRAPESPALARYDEIARIVTGHPDATALDGVRWVEELVTALAVPALGTYGLRESQLPEVAAKAARASSMAGNPVELTEAELRSILERAL
jgi:alcohol dehydrogenase class IV